VFDLLRKLLPLSLDAEIFAISSARPSEEFLSKCCVLSQVEEDEPTSNKVKSSAKVVAIVDRSTNVSEAASILGTSILSFSGRSAYAPDIVLVNEFVADGFLFHLARAITSPMSKRSPTASQHRFKAQSDADSQTLEERKSNKYLKVIMSGANGSIVEIRDRYVKASLFYPQSDVCFAERKLLWDVGSKVE
jgi:hypothetical protein